MFRISLLWQDIVRLRTAISVAAVCGVYPGFYPVSHGQQAEVSLDLQAHRGGLGLITESTLQAFANALELGVTTLELDTQVTRDGYVVVTHDRQVLAHRCLDTAPATTNDADFPYVGKYIKDLTLAQVRGGLWRRRGRAGGAQTGSHPFPPSRRSRRGRLPLPEAEAKDFGERWVRKHAAAQQLRRK
jgi:hypothetical protein